MNRPNAAQMDWARRLLAHEDAADRADGRVTTAAGRVYDKLHAHMSPLVGVAGIHLLFVRSAKLAQGELTWLAEVPISEGPKKLRECLHARDPAVATESVAILFGTFFTLVATFIGERLTTQVLRTAWPTFEETAPGEKNE